MHHHRVHEGGWTITVAAEGTLLFHSPAGETLAAEPPRERVDDALGWLRGWAEQNNLDLGPEVNRPRWDGKHPDYALAVEALLTAG